MIVSSLATQLTPLLLLLVVATTTTETIRQAHRVQTPTLRIKVQLSIPSKRLRRRPKPRPLMADWAMDSPGTKPRRRKGGV